ncbi:N-acetylmuramoyl-L-alanine amidase [Brunnivagina elsteri]|uniref:N-acetylmuramoyl-L-alanine amidase n=1 Tax=Brunnivagina elsteri CCALA 953 TaxID=987040 RepID=A0A2A2TGV4_9CYAN|nr:N-acetylmuramoyl-L-alanine amidase [Calothrix elsteri]PAX52858.1 N-acetylmuramoyl-L-alanine amidase [Calothrix elsteri CCALA 953]
MTLYAIDLGHGCDYDGGAIAIKKEEDFINSVGLLLIKRLMQLGHEVIACRPSKASSLNNSLQQRCDRANNAKADIFVSLHANCFNTKAYGTEVFAMSPRGEKIARDICREISLLGFFNRGVKSGSHLYVVKNTNMVAVLVEMCFIDSARDVALFDAKYMADAICLGLTGRLPVDEKVF